MLAVMSVLVVGDVANADHAVVSPCDEPRTQAGFVDNACRENLADAGIGRLLTTVNVPFGAGDRILTTTFGDVQQADPEKLDFALIDPPSELEAHTVRASPEAVDEHVVGDLGNNEVTAVDPMEVFQDADLRVTDVIVDLEADPRAADPRAADLPGTGMDLHVVPTCVETVNPHGEQIPQAPGTGQNEDGFYVIGSLPGFVDQAVWVRDNGTGITFGPFGPGTRIKYVEANGARSSISTTGGNNGRGDDQASAVDYQIRGRGDMAVVVFDEDGGEVSTLCLVPPRPK